MSDTTRDLDPSGEVTEELPTGNLSVKEMASRSAKPVIAVTSHVVDDVLPNEELLHFGKPPHSSGSTIALVCRDPYAAAGAEVEHLLVARVDSDHVVLGIGGQTCRDRRLGAPPSTDFITVPQRY